MFPPNPAFFQDIALEVLARFDPKLVKMCPSGERPEDWSLISPELAATVERAESAAKPPADWNLLKFHTDQVAITFLTYPNFDEDPHPALAEATKINLNSGALLVQRGNG